MKGTLKQGRNQDLERATGGKARVKITGVLGIPSQALFTPEFF